MAGVPRGSVGSRQEGRADSAHPITLFMLEHADILNSHDYIHESKLRIGILLEILASAKEEAPSFLAVILEGRQGKTACGDALQAISNSH